MPSNDPGLAQAMAYVKAHSTPPTALPFQAPALRERPKQGKNIYYLDCGLPNCKQIGDGLDAAAAVLHWKVTHIEMGSTPDQIQGAWNVTVQGRPDAVIAAGVTKAEVAGQLAELKSRGVPYLAIGTTDKLDDEMIGNIPSAADFVVRGQMMANWVIADSKAEADSVVFNIPDFPVLKLMQDAIQTTMSTRCQRCKLAVQNTTAGEIATTLPGRVVSYVQANPDTQYILMYADAAIGVAEALDAAGLGHKVKIVTQASGPSNLKNIKNGLVEAVTIPDETVTIGWRLLDIAARHFEGMDLSCCAEGIDNHSYLTKANIGDPNEPYVYPADYQELYKKLWRY